MARPLRFPSPATELKPGRLYHVTNRGVDRCDLFHSDLDRIVFLAMLADACREMEVVCHAFCLMTNHFHLVIEDTRGLLSQFMHRLEAPYARFFNDTRAPRKRTGHVFQGRFHSDEIDTRTYFDAACAYVLDNPIRTMPPMAAQPDDFAWSSARFTLGEAGTTAAAYCAGLLEPFGGIEGVLSVFAPAARVCSADLRRRRFEALVSGVWLDRDRLLDGRSQTVYRAHLAARSCAPSPFTRSVEAPTVESTEQATIKEIGDEHRETRLRRSFAGLELSGIRERVETACSHHVPVPLHALPAALAYLLRRFCNASLVELSRSLHHPPEAVEAMINSVREARASNAALNAGYSRAEWALHWSILAAPCHL